jgi:hypothetical protein
MDLFCPTFKPPKHNIFDTTFKVDAAHGRPMGQSYHLPEVVRILAAS